MANFVLPYEPQSVDHREAERQHRETQEWLRRRTIEIATQERSIIQKAPAEEATRTIRVRRLAARINIAAAHHKPKPR